MRSILKNLSGLAGLLALTLLLPGCGPRRPALYVYTWADYIKPELVRRFEKEHGCRVVIDTFDSNEVLYAKMRAGATGYDVLFPSSYMVKLMWTQNMLQPLDRNQLPNLRHVDPDYLAAAMDSEMSHSVPYMLTTTVIAWIGDRVADVEPSWSQFAREDLRGRMTLLNDMRETLGAGLKSLGYSLNSTDEKEVEAAGDRVLEWVRNIAKFENEQYKTGLASGEFLLVHGYSGDILQAMETNDQIEMAVPAEGTALSCDDMVIPAGARQVALAHAFINFLHDPEVAAQNSDYIGYVCPNAAAYPLMSEDLRANPALFLAPEIRQRCEMIDDVGEAIRIYTRVWDRVKAAE
ncbi:MAG: spermidine/putrescine ABC transporter substrate-binding protein [Kiritimatiellia bacterium]|nr:spermidine/putrescine ABC transporter substrate-binding protein [Kiritimatiellia bacterium]